MSSLDSLPSNADLQSKVISFLRFPLIVAVVMIHTSPQHVQIGDFELIDVNNLGLYGYIYNLINEIIARSAVPLFFFISGFLFFKGRQFTFSIYLQKLKRRVKTILLPYLIWNLIALMIMLSSQILSSGSANINISNLINFKYWLSIFWDYNNNNCPICFQLWFLRDLMVVMIISPIIYWGIRLLKLWCIVLLGFLWLTNYWVQINGISISAIFFFSLGSYFMIEKKNFVDILLPYRNIAIITYVILCAANLLFFQDPWIIYIHNITIIIGMVVAIILSSHFIQNGTWRVNEFLSESSFFIYVYHAIVLFKIQNVLVVKVFAASSTGLLGTYFLSPTITILIGLGIYWTLKRFFPKFTNFITEGR